MKWLLTVLLVLAIVGIALAILVGVQVDVSSQIVESYTEREPYSVEVTTPLKYRVVSSRSYRTGLFDVVDNQEIVIRNDDTASGAFQVQCRFTDQRGGVRHDTKSVALVPGETKTIICIVDTYRADRISYAYDVIAPMKAASVIRYREVPRTRVVKHDCSMSLIKKAFYGSC